MKKLIFILLIHFSMSNAFLLDQTNQTEHNDKNDAIVLQNLKENHTKLQLSYDDLNNKYTIIAREQEIVRNKTQELTRILDGFKDINVIQELHALKEQVKAIGAKTYMLDSNDRARNMDISYLYNISTQSNKTWSEFYMKSDYRFQQIDQLIQNVSVQFYNQNKTYHTFDRRFKAVDTILNETVKTLNKQMNEFELTNNITHEGLIKRVAENNEKVAMTACVSVDGIKSQGSVIKFDQFRSHTGITNVSAVRSSGKFTCEKAGLYHISVVINTPTANAAFSIYNNGNEISKLLISNDNHVDTGTSVIAVELQVDDIVWVQAECDIHVYFHWSCMTVVKI